MKVHCLGLVVLLLGLAQGRVLTPEVQDSLRAIHPRQRAHWLKERGVDTPGYTRPFFPESLNMTCIGRWSYGPAYDITGRIAGHDTILFLARGSGVSVLRFHGGAQPGVTLLSDINAMGLVKRVAVQDSWLFVGSSGFEIYNIAQPTNPARVSWTNAAISDFAVQGSYLYGTSNDTFRVFDISNKAGPFQVGAVSDSGSTIAVAGDKAFLLWGTFGWHGMYILDISNPAAPHRAGVWNSTVGSVAAQRNLCYVSDAGRFHILNVSNPASPQELSSVGIGGNIYLDGDFAYLSTFAVIDVMDSLLPGIVGQCSLPTEATLGVWATGLSGSAFVACYADGLGILDLSDPVHPVLDSIGVLAYADSRDVDVQGSRAIVANNTRGVRLLNVADPAHPFEIAAYDTVGQPPTCDAALLSGSLAYVDWTGRDGWRGLYVVSLADSLNPVLVGKTATFNPIQAMAIRDSWCYAGEASRFEVIAIADSIHPSVASRCTLQALAFVNDVQVIESTAYVANSSGGLRMIDITQPRSATPLGYYMPSHSGRGMAVQETIAYVGTNQGLSIANVASSSAPYEITFYPTQGWVRDAAVRGGLVYLTDRSTILNVSNPAAPYELGFYENGPSPWLAFWYDSLIYVACLEGGIAVLQYTGPNACLDEPGRGTRAAGLSVFPNPTQGRCFLRVGRSPQETHVYGLYDLSGRLVRHISTQEVRSRALDLRRLETGVYFLKDCTDGSLCRITLVK